MLRLEVSDIRGLNGSNVEFINEVLLLGSKDETAIENNVVGVLDSREGEEDRSLDSMVNDVNR